MSCNACGKITKNDAFVCRECGEVNCLECRVKNPKGLKLPICTLCGTDLLSPISEEENRKEEDAKLQFENPMTPLIDWAKSGLELPEIQKLLKPPKSNNCPECSFPILSSYHYSNQLDQEFGEEHRFCSERCMDNYKEKKLCTECFSRLPNIYWYNEELNRAYGKDYRFCSDACLTESLSEKMCAECGSKNPSIIKHSEKADSELGRKHIFCSEQCGIKFLKKYFCSTCGSKIEGQYYYCRLCGDGPRYCSSSCLQDHSDNSNAFLCLINYMAK